MGELSNLKKILKEINEKENQIVDKISEQQENYTTGTNDYKV